MRLIAPFGFYGWGNIGDEASLQGFARLTARRDGRVEAWVGARNPRHCRKAEPSFKYFDAVARRSVLRHWAWRTADAMVVAGGTPIGDALGRWPLSEVVPLVNRAAAAGLPIAFVGTGTEELRREESRQLLAETLGPKVTAWSVRSERDRARLVEYGVPGNAIVTAADMAWGLDAVTPDAGMRYLTELGVNVAAPIIGVNVNIEQFVREQNPRLLAEIAEFLDRIVERQDATILFLCNEVRPGDTFDLAASRELIAHMHRQDRATIVPNEYWLPQMMMSMIACCRFTVSTRYHFCLFSAVQGVPYLAVERSNKVADLSADLGWKHRIALTSARSDALETVFTGMADHHSDLVRFLCTAVPQMRQRAHRNDEAIASIAGEGALAR